MKPCFTVLLLSFAALYFTIYYYYFVTPAIYIMTKMMIADLNPVFESL